MADVSVELGLDAKQLYQELQQVTNKFGQFATQTQQHGELAGGGFLNGIKNKLSGVGSAFSGIGGQLSGLFGAYLGVSQLQRVIDKADEIHQTSHRFGVDAQQLQVLANAGKTSGITMEQMAKAMSLIAINAQQALTPTSKQAIAMQQLGIEAQSFSRLNPQAQILRLADAYKGSAQDGAAFAAVSQLIGRRNTAMIPLLQQGSKEILNQGTAFATMADSEIENLHRLKVEQEKFIAGLDHIFSSSITGWKTFFDTIVANSADATTKLHNNIGRVINAATGRETVKIETPHAAQDLESKQYQEQFSPEQRGIPQDKKPPTATAQDIKNENEGGDGSKKDDSDIARIRELSRPKSGFEEVQKLMEKAKREKASALRADFRTNRLEARGDKEGFQGLTLQELATKGTLIGGPGGIARQAEQEEKLAKQSALGGDLKGAQSHTAQAEQLKKSLGPLLAENRQKEALKAALDDSRLLKEISTNTKGIGTNQ